MPMVSCLQMKDVAVYKPSLVPVGGNVIEVKFNDGPDGGKCESSV